MSTMFLCNYDLSNISSFTILGSIHYIQIEMICSQESFRLLVGVLAKSFGRTFPAFNCRTVILEAQSPKAKCKVCRLLYNDTLLIALMTASGNRITRSQRT